MNGTLFMIELTVADWEQALVWYRDGLDLAVALLDRTRQFALLEAGAVRLSLKAGVPTPGGVTLYFEVADLQGELDRLHAQGIHPSSPIKTSNEGYRRVLLRDPDGYTVGLFDWIKD